MQQLPRRHIAVFTLLLLANVAFFGFTSPLESSSALLFIGFGLLAVDLYLLLIGLLLLTGKIKGSQWKQPRIFAATWTVLLIVLLSLQSIGQLSLRDSVAVIVVGVIFLMYSSYYRKKR
jgi:hypothetical protein